MSEDAKSGETFLPKTGPGHASAQARNSTFYLNVPNERLGQVTKFRMALAQVVFWGEQNFTTGHLPPPPRPTVVMLNRLYKRFVWEFRKCTSCYKNMRHLNVYNP